MFSFTFKKATTVWLDVWQDVVKAHLLTELQSSGSLSLCVTQQVQTPRRTFPKLATLQHKSQTAPTLSATSKLYKTSGQNHNTGFFQVEEFVLVHTSEDCGKSPPFILNNKMVSVCSPPLRHANILAPLSLKS